MKITRILAKIMHRENGRVERSVQIFDGTKMLAAIGSSIKEKKAEPLQVQPIIEEIEEKIPDYYLEPLIRMGCVQTH